MIVIKTGSTQVKMDRLDTIVTKPDLTAVFDEQYNRVLGFENEKLLEEKRSGRYLFW